MNAFASPEEAMPYEFPQFPKPEGEVTEYAYIEGAVGYQFNDLQTPGNVYSSGDESAPVVQPVVFQDFKEVLTAVQS